jgi:putative holliday junction resolvase
MQEESLISIDYGTRKSGLAYSVEGFCFAHKTVETRELIEYLKKWATEKNASKIIIGLPLNIDGTESKHSKRVRIFAESAKIIFPEREIILHDESMTTSEARLS